MSDNAECGEHYGLVSIAESGRGSVPTCCSGIERLDKYLGWEGKGAYFEGL